MSFLFLNTMRKFLLRFENLRPTLTSQLRLSLSILDFDKLASQMLLSLWGNSNSASRALSFYVNGTPVIWGSYKQTSVADSTCAAEFVAASVCAKQLTHVENMFRFLGFTCPKPYVLYTDSKASQSIATNAIKMGKIRHIAIGITSFGRWSLVGRSSSLSASLRT
jgi:hypothetical protein